VHAVEIEDVEIDRVAFGSEIEDETVATICLT
jgi:hypothetical protein